jgi:hypothetical protein
MNKSRLFVTASAALIVAGCASNPVAEYQELREEKREARIEVAEERFEKTPDWYLAPPKSDDTGVYAVGFYQSKNLQFALDQAKLLAEFNLAKAYKQEISGAERNYIRSTSDGGVISSSEQTIDKLVDSAEIVGYVEVEQETILLGENYHHFVLLHMPFEQGNPVLQNRTSVEAYNEAQQKYQELNERLNDSGTN